MRRKILTSGFALALVTGLLVQTGSAGANKIGDGSASVKNKKHEGMKLTLRGPKGLPDMGDAVTVRGTAKLNKQPLTRVTVQIQYQAGTWVTVGRATTGTRGRKKGKFRQQVTVPRSPTVTLRARLVKPKRLRDARSRPRTVRFRQPAPSTAPALPSATRPAVKAPSAPTSITARAGDGDVRLTWTAPTNDGGTALQGYLIQTKTTKDWTTVTSRNALTATVAAPNGQRRSYRVAAVNSAGVGAFSTPSKFVLPVDPSKCLVHNDDYTVLTYDRNAVQAAINDDTSTGDTLTVSGTCNEHNISTASDKTVTLTGTGTIDAQRDAHNNGSVIVNKGHLTITGDITITGGNLAFSGGGGGIDNNSGTLILRNNAAITGNAATATGGGVRNHNDGSVALHDNASISGNTANSGGGIYNDRGAVAVNDGTIAGNNANTSGGGVYNNSGVVTVSGGTVAANNANFAGGGIYNSGGSVTLIDTAAITANTAVWFGGGIYNNSGLVALRDISGVSGNTAWSGGGIFQDNATVIGNLTSVTGNSPNDILE